MKLILAHINFNMGTECVKKLPTFEESLKHIIINILYNIHACMAIHIIYVFTCLLVTFSHYCQ